MAKLIANQQQDSKDWFIGKAKTAAGYRKKILSNTERARDDAVIGKMYFFMYDPKWKDILPVYDRFPLVFPIEPYPDGFLGLNLHYLTPAERKWLIDNLAKISGVTKYDKRTRMKLSYSLLSATKKLATVSKPCIKRYLFSHVRSSFIEITADEWYKAINLPVAMLVYNE